MDASFFASSFFSSALVPMTPPPAQMAFTAKKTAADTAAQGVGKKLAQRIILELKDKMGGANTEIDFSAGVSVAAPTGNNTQLATAALQELGYSPAEIATALKGVDPSATTEEMVRFALRAMVMKG